MPKRLPVEVVLEREAKYKAGFLWCNLHKSFLPQEKFSPSPTQVSNYGHRYYCRECETKKSYYQNKPRWNQAAKDRNKVIKAHYVELMGNCCQKCGYSDSIYALEFHHVDRSQKELHINPYMYDTNKKEQLLKELDKCCLLCSNCHRTYTARVWEAVFIKRVTIGYTIQENSIILLDVV